MFAKFVLVCLIVFCCTKQIECGFLRAKLGGSVDFNLSKTFGYPIKIGYNQTEINETNQNENTAFEEAPYLDFKTIEANNSTGN